MTGEELKLEAEKFARTEMSHPNEYGMYYCTFLKVAEPREKRIAELEDKLANADYQLEGRDNEIRELEKQLKAEHTKGEIDFVNMHCNSTCKKVKELEDKIEHLTKHLEPQSMSVLFEQVEEEVKQKQRIKELEAQIEKMKCCENCKYNSYWGNELHCNYGLKEALQEDKLVECKNMDKWEIKEK